MLPEDHIRHRAGRHLKDHNGHGKYRLQGHYLRIIQPFGKPKGRDGRSHDQQAPEETAGDVPADISFHTDIDIKISTTDSVRTGLMPALCLSIKNPLMNKVTSGFDKYNLSSYVVYLPLKRAGHQAPCFNKQLAFVCNPFQIIKNRSIYLATDAQRIRNMRLAKLPGWPLNEYQTRFCHKPPLSCPALRSLSAAADGSTLRNRTGCRDHIHGARWTDQGRDG